VGLLLLAAALPLAARALAGPRGAVVHVRWQPSITAADRQALEARFRLIDGAQLDAATWRYDLIDPSRRNLAALVGEPLAADTHNIDRSNGSLDPSAIRTRRQGRFPASGDALVTGADRFAAALAGFTALLLLIAATAHTQSARAARQHARRAVDLARDSVLGPVVRFLQRGIPDIDAQTAGLFRIVFGTAALAYFLLYPVDASWLDRTFDLEIDGPVHQAVMEWLRARPVVVDLVGPWLLVTGAAFIAGLFTRITYTLFVAGALTWAYVAVSLSSTHPQSILILTLVALLPSRWGDAMSVDAWRQARSGRSTILPAGTRYGYSVWVPVLAFGVAFAAAAWAKLTVPPGWTSWIVNGTVKYYFITDSVNAPVQWGLQLAAHPWLAVLASFIAIATESLVVTSAFIKNEWYRLIMGAAAVGLIAGFGVFMGVFWPGWWVPLLGFLPWQRLTLSRLAISQVRSVRLPPSLKATADHRDGPPWRTVQPALPSRVASRPGLGGGGQADPTGPAKAGHYVVSAAQLAAIVFVLGQQIVVSALRIERAPMFTNYPMYSYTFSSPAEFNAWMPPVYRIVVTTDAGSVELRCRANENLVEELHSALGGSSESAATVWRAVRACRGEDLSGARALVFEEDRLVFDWDRLHFNVTRAAVVHGPLSADAYTGC